MKSFFLSLVLFSLAVTPALAEQVLVAVAANFVPPFREVAMEFEKATGHTVQVASGSSGNFYTQIKNGAPFDVFFSADNERPKLLEEEGLGVKGSRFTYAIGRLVLWSPDSNLVKGEDTLRSGRFQASCHRESQDRPLWRGGHAGHAEAGGMGDDTARLVLGENLGQTIGFIESGNAELGFLALSQVMDPKIKGKGSRWDVPVNLHEPIQQDVVLLAKGKDNPAAKALMEFMSRPQATAIIERYGYELK